MEKLDIEKETLNKLYWGDKLSTLTIGRMFGVSGSTIATIMERHQLKRRTPGEYLKGHHMSFEARRKSSENQRGDKKKSWKGGRHIDANGYARVVIRCDDFFFPMSGTRSHFRGYVMEHRLIMAKHLNRCLLPWEIVHHKNGIRDDNRLENLELLSDRKHKPSSQLARHIKQKEDEAYKRGIEDGKKQVLEAQKKEGIHVERLEDSMGRPMWVDYVGNRFPIPKFSAKSGWLVFIEETE